MKKLLDSETIKLNRDALMKLYQTDGKESLPQKTNSTEVSQKLETSLTDVLTVGTINKLFAKLQARYGNQWVNQWDDDRIYKMAINEWYEELKHLSLDDLRKGLNNYRGDFPPNLIQFYDACTQPPVGHPSPCYNFWGGNPNAVPEIEDKSKKEKSDKYMKEKGNAYIERIRKENGWIK